MGGCFDLFVGNVLGFFLTASAELHRNYRHPTCIHLWTWREFLNWTADKATLTHYTTFWAIYIYHVEADMHKVDNNFHKQTDKQSKHSTTSWSLGLYQGENRKNRMWSKGHRDNCQHFIRRGNVTQGKLNLNKRWKFLAYLEYLWLLTGKGSPREPDRIHYLSNVYNIRWCTSSCWYFWSLHTLLDVWEVWIKVKLTRFVDMWWQFLPWLCNYLSPPPTI